MQFKPDLLKYQIMYSDNLDKWGVVVLYKDGIHEQSCAMLVEKAQTWGEVIDFFIPWLTAEIKTKIEQIKEESA